MEIFRNFLKSGNFIWVPFFILFLIPRLLSAQDIYHQPESITYDTLTDSYYISNWGDGNIIKIDKYGFVRFFNTGYLITAGGMIIVDNVLYVCSSDGPNEGLAGFDLNSGEAVFQMVFSGMGLVNDVTADTSGHLYATDTEGNRIYKINISEHNYSVLAYTPAQPNGTLYDKRHDRLLVCYNPPGAPLHAYDPDDGSVSVLVSYTMGGNDGLTEDKLGRIYLSSSYYGTVVRYDSAFSTVPETVVSGYGGCADIYYNQKTNILAIPDIVFDEIAFVNLYVDFSADNIIGWPPLEVNFNATPLVTVNEWIWDFGDGDSAFIPSPGHVYEEPGVYDVTVAVELDRNDTIPCTRLNYITVLADTLTAGNIEGGTDSLLLLPVYVTNVPSLTRMTIPFEYSGAVGLTYKGYSLEGCRTADFESVDYINYDANNKRFCLNFEVGPPDYMLPGAGPVVVLKFEINTPEVDSGEVTSIVMDGYGSYLPAFFGYYYGDYNYEPAINSGSVTYVKTSCCEGVTGDADCSGGEPDISDITRLIDYLYLSHKPLCCLEEADVNASGGEPDISDITYLIDHLYLSHKALKPCP
jgi:PKD repeat protein